MQLLSRNANLGSQTKHATVSEARADIYIDRSGINARKESLRRINVTSHDALRVLSTKSIDVLDCRINAGNDMNGKIKRIVLTRPIILCGRNVLRALIEAILGACGQGGLVTMNQDAPSATSTHEARQEFARNVLVNKHRLDRIADARPLGLCVFDNRNGHVKIGGRVNVDMAIALARLDHRDGRLLDAGANERVAAARNEDVNETVGMHKLKRLRSIRRVDDTRAVSRKSGRSNAVATGLGNSLAGIMSRGAATEDHGIARTQCKTDGVGSDVGPSLVHHRNNAEGYANLGEANAGGKRPAANNLADGVSLGGNFSHAGNNTIDASIIKHQTIKQRTWHAGLAATFHIAAVSLENGRPRLNHGICRCKNRLAA